MIEERDRAPKVAGKSKVALVRCESYDEDAVRRAIEAGIDLLGGLPRFARAGERIVLKPNVLIGTDPDKCVVTHPSILKAAGRILLEAGVSAYYGDSPAIGGAERNLKRARLKQAADEVGLTLADFDHGRSVNHSDALLVKSFVIANGVLESDGVISLCKLKTHGLTRFTGAVKNTFGCIPGTFKAQHHARTPDPYLFGTMLVDLNTLVRPRLYIMDGIMAMEGNGPRSGTPKKLNVLLFSEDPIAIDSVACRIIDLDPEYVPSSKPGEQAGLGTYHRESIELVGDDIETFVDKSFEVVRQPPVPAGKNRMANFIKNRICPRPVINGSLCTNCGTCVRMCPVDPKAVDWHTGDKSKQPTHKYGRCIRCFCCGEVCPEGAIDVQNTLLGRVFFPMK